MSELSNSLDKTNSHGNILLAATSNRNKLIEIEAITARYGLKIISRDQAGIPNDFDVTEDGETFEENSEKKAFAFMRLTGLPSIADDSGLEVVALKGEPGIHSARYAGVMGPDQDKANRTKLLQKLASLPYEKREAKFVSVITLVYPNGEKLTARGEVKGHIAFEEKGVRGFGYDNIFLPQGFSLTFAEMSQEEKNMISHRKRALESLAILLEKKESHV